MNYREVRFLRLSLKRNHKRKQVNMTKLKSILLAVGCVAALTLSTGNVAAQGRGNFDPAQFRQMRLDRYKEQLDVTDDGEWKVIEGAIGKVMDAQQEAAAGMIRGAMGGFGGGRNRGGDTNSAAGDQGGGRRRGGFNITPSPEAEALQKAIDDKAPADEIKAKLAKLREVNAATEAKLTAAQEDLKKLLTSRQEAVAVLGGLLK
jgi:hypothetical protein